MSSEEDERNDKLVRSADFDGPTRHRHCTDILCLGLIIVMWVVMTAIGIYAISDGDYRLVLFPMDYDGNVCGAEYNGVDMTDYPNLFYVNSYTGGVCVSECPSIARNLTNEEEAGSDAESNATITTQRVDVRTFITYGGVWQADGAWLEKDFIQMADYNFTSDAQYCTEETCFPEPDNPAASWTSRGVRKGFGYAYYAGDTYELLWRCYYTTEAERQIEEALESDGTLEIVDDATAVWNHLFADMYTARKYIFGFGFGVSLAISLVYIFLMRLPVLLDIMVWTSIFATIGLFFVGGYYSWELADEWNTEDPQTMPDKTITVGSVLIIALTVSLFLVTATLTHFLFICPFNFYENQATQGAAVILYILGSLLLVLTVR